MRSGDDFRDFVENAVVGIFRTTPEGRYLIANPALARMYGFQNSEALKSSLTDIAEQLYVDSSRRDAFRELLLVQDEIHDFESEIRRRDGSRLWISEDARVVRDAYGCVLYYEGTVTDVTDRKSAEEQLIFLAYYDPMTGLTNRNRFIESVNQRLRSGTGAERAVMASIGVDRLNVVNTTLGHSVGDAVLTTLAERLKGCVEELEHAARAGGDRFLICFVGPEEESEMLSRVEAVMHRLQEPIPVGSEAYEVTVSVGYSLYPEDGGEGDVLVKNADVALQRAKAGGPGSVLRFNAKMNDGAAKSLSLQHLLRVAIEQEEFVPYFQPLNELGEGRIVGLEALVRWMSPKGMISPGLFIPMAEESGLIEAIGEQVLKAVCRQIRAWLDMGLQPPPVAVNVSGRQFHQPRRLVRILESLPAESNLPPGMIELELTESSAMRDPEAAIAVVRMLGEMGFRCSIDDFGTGYSSLSVLKRFPIQKLKIDRSFVLDVTTDPNDAAIVNAIVAMAHALKLKVVAEGVEAHDHLDFLKELGCDQIQGYVFSRPLPAAEIQLLLAEDKRLPLRS